MEKKVGQRIRVDIASFNPGVITVDRRVGSPEDLISKRVTIDPALVERQWGADAAKVYIGEIAARVRAENEAHPGAFRRSGF